MHLHFIRSLFFLLAGISGMVLLTVKYRVHAFFALLLVCFVVGLGAGLPVNELTGAIKTGFGNILQSIGLIIVLGTTLGVVLEYTGSTQVMAETVLRWVGKKRAALAMSLTGFLVGLPIFCDAGFIVLSGLNRTLARQTGISLVVMSVSLATGLYSIHCLAPPHPGAAAAAGIIGVDPGRLILMGILVAIPAALAGYLWARRAGKMTFYTDSKTDREGRKTDGEGIDKGMYREGADDGGARNKGTATYRPTAIRAFLPVLVPIGLIALKSILLVYAPMGKSGWPVLLAAGDPMVALSSGILLAFMAGRSWDREKISRLLTDSAEKAGGILVIIGAGGAFGAVLAATGMGAQLGEAMPLHRLGIFFPFLLCCVLKTAQGSSTVAIITAASIVLPLLPALGLDTENGRLLCVLSMGAGSMFFSHANDAYFWVITRFSGLSMNAMLGVYTVATGIMGLVSFLVVWILSLFL